MKKIFLLLHHFLVFLYPPYKCVFMTSICKSDNLTQEPAHCKSYVSSVYGVHNRLSSDSINRGFKGSSNTQWPEIIT